jgi:hypothetical protein
MSHENSATEREPKENSIFVKVSDETRDIIDEYKEQEKVTISQIIADAIKMYDRYKSMAPEVMAIISNYKDEYGGIPINLIEEAIKVFAVHKESGVEELWVRAREEMDMMLIGKTTFNQLLAAAAAPEERLDKPQKKNVGFDTILWYTGKQIKSLSLEEIMEAVKIIWLMANYFSSIEIKKENGDSYHMIFKHGQKKRYSEYWGQFFIELLTSDELSFKCVIEEQYFEETISLLIKLGYEKK